MSEQAKARVSLLDICRVYLRPVHGDAYMRIGDELRREREIRRARAEFGQLVEQSEEIQALGRALAVMRRQG